MQSAGQAYGRECGFSAAQSPILFRAKGITGKVDERPENPAMELGSHAVSVAPASERSK